MPSDSEYLAEIESSAPEAQTTQDPAPQPTEEMYSTSFQNQNLKIPASAELELNHAGQLMKVPYSKIINAYRQNAHLEDKYKTFNTERDQFTQNQADNDKYKAFHEKYSDLQNWSEQNPDQFQAVWDGYQNRDKLALQNQMQGQEGVQPLMDEIASLKGTVGELTQYKTQQEKILEEQTTAKDMEEVQADIDKFKGDFPELQLDERDESGQTGWAKIVNYGVQHGIPNFRAAALQMHEAQLLDVIQARARNDAVKGIKQDNKAGIVSRSEAPQMQNQGKRPPIDHSKMSWDQIGDVARESYNQMSAQGD